MSSTIERTFQTRRQVELAVERLVQEHGFERTDVFISPAGDENSAGNKSAGDDTEERLSGEQDDAPHCDPISVSVDVNDDARAAVVAQVFDEISGS